MGIRLNKVLSELNIGIHTAVEFLKGNHIGEIRDDAIPNTKITDDQYLALKEKFGGNKEKSAIIQKSNPEIKKEEQEYTNTSGDKSSLLKNIQKNDGSFYLHSGDEINSLFNELKKNNLAIDNEMDFAIRMAIRKVKLQIYYESKRNEYNRQRHQSIPTNISSSTSTSINGTKTKKQIRAEQRKKKVSEMFTRLNSVETTVESNLSKLFYTTQTIDYIIEFLKQHRNQFDSVTERWIRSSINGTDILDYYMDKMSSEFSNYRDLENNMQSLEAKENEEGINKRLKAFRKAILLYIDKRRKGINRQNIKKKKETKPAPETVFNVQKGRDWILDWNCVMFRRGSVIIFSRSNLGLSFKPKEMPVRHSLESFNYLKKYLNERLPPVRCTIIGQKLKVIDNINFSKAILQFEEASRQSAIKIGTGTNSKYSPSPMSFSQALSKAQKMTPEEFRKYKSKYIDFLVDLQSKKYKVIPCVERLAHSNSDSTEYAFMFAIECKSKSVLIVHENVNPDRSTLLFLVYEENYDKAIREIYGFLQSPEINKRSSLREKALVIKNADIQQYRSINHDEFYSWKGWITFYKNYK